MTLFQNIMLLLGYLKYLVQIFTNVCEMVTFYVGYNSIYIYSKCQLMCIKVNSHAQHFLRRVGFRNNNSIHCIECVANKGKSQYLYDTTVISDHLTIVNTISAMRYANNADKMFIYSTNQLDADQESKVLDKVCFNNVDEIVWKNNNILYEYSLHKFISIKLKIASNVAQEHDIKLQTNEYNFYIINNRLNARFIKYYCRYVLNLSELLEDNMIYTLSIVDGDVNIFEIDETDELILEKNKYRINKNNQLIN
jgi:hypothetical protein